MTSLPGLSVRLDSTQARSHQQSGEFRFKFLHAMMIIVLHINFKPTYFAYFLHRFAYFLFTELRSTGILVGSLHTLHIFCILVFVHNLAYF